MGTALASITVTFDLVVSSVGVEQPKQSSQLCNLLHYSNHTEIFLEYCNKRDNEIFLELGILLVICQNFMKPCKSWSCLNVFVPPL